MKKQLFFAALALTTLAGCSDDSFVGDQSPTSPIGNTDGAIQFVSSTPNITRSEGATAAAELDYKFAVYAIKTMPDGPDEGTDPDLINVFARNEYSSSTNLPYWVWYTDGTANSTTSNTASWEYVGTGGTGGTSFGTTGHQVTLNEGVEQTIKYWDYAATNYIFTAYTNKSGGEVSNVTIDGFNFTGDAAAFAGLYVADKLTITEKSNPAAHGTADNKIGDAVKFTFRSGAAKVRVGIYETIAGYKVKNVNFKPTSPATFDATTANAMLSGSFNGSSPSTTQAFTVTYGASGASIGTTVAASNNYNFGTFTTSDENYLGESSTTPKWASGDYISVLPNTEHTGNMVLNVDFDLYNTTTHETIHVTDAKAVVPSSYMTWYPNTAYTYLFKICDNTNGYTGPAASPRGLYPITFDAVTVAATDATLGTITTVSTPSITTIQNGSVSEAGITYANVNGPITITVNTNGTLADLGATGTTVKLWTVPNGTTEADLLLATSLPGKTDVTTGGSDALTVSGTSATFTPTANTTYAFEYSKEAVVAVYSQASGTFVSGTKYYTDNTGATEVDTSSFTATTGVSSYYVLTTPAEAAVKAYKVIQIVAAP